MTGQEALAVLDAAIVAQKQQRQAQADRVRDEALQVALRLLSDVQQAINKAEGMSK